ncbi:MAG: TetR/AcrR family transcriptional regulator [Lachnospiraceae bacterium]|nr:TetR/AcrR family transcriptional regulator [Lachnospiraceae bacterium]
MGTRKKVALEQFNRDNIITAAKELFETKGIEKTTMDDIAKLADYSKSTIYVYFKSKEDIYNKIVKEYLDMLTGELEVYIEGEEDFESSYYGVCDCLVRFEEKYPQYYASLMGEGKMTNSKKANTTTDIDMTGGLESLIRRLLEKGLRHKFIRTDLEIQPTVLYMWSAISGIIQVAERHREGLDLRLNMNKEEYLRYSFKTFYESLVRR